MDNFEYVGNLNIIVNGKNVKVSKVILAEVSLNKKCEVIIVTRDGSTLSGIMENGSYKELEKDLLKYVEKYTTR
jgi:predicted RNA-binding protein with PUA domain